MKYERTPSLYVKNRHTCTDVTTPQARLMAAVYWPLRAVLLEVETNRKLDSLASRWSITRV